MASSGAGPSDARSAELRRSTTVVRPKSRTRRATSAGDSSCRLSARSSRPATVWPPSSVGRAPRSRTLTAPSRSIHTMPTPLQMLPGSAGPGLRRSSGVEYQPGEAYWINRNAAQNPAARGRAGTGPASSWFSAGGGLLTGAGSGLIAAVEWGSHDVALIFFRPTRLSRPACPPPGRSARRALGDPGGGEPGHRYRGDHRRAGSDHPVGPYRAPVADPAHQSAAARPGHGRYWFHGLWFGAPDRQRGPVLARGQPPDHPAPQPGGPACARADRVRRRP